MSVLLLWVSWGCAPPDSPLYAPGAEPEAAASPSGPFAPIPEAEGLDPEIVALGRRLFHDPRLSGDGTISCASCHPLERTGIDGRVRSIGVGGAVGSRNTPTVFNAGLWFRQFWDGRAETLEAQIDGPLLDPAEMGGSWPGVLAALGRDPVARDFGRLYPDGLTQDNVRHALATFERALFTPNSPFDRYLSGEEEALSPAQRRGLEVFLDYGCASCHQGVGLGGSMFQRFGLFGEVRTDDPGRMRYTGQEQDRNVFKVPSLRNVALTAPYFHDGSAATLGDAVTTMARVQLGRELPEQEHHDVVAFLTSLTGELPPVLR